MTTLLRFSFIEIFTLLLAVWTGFIYVLLLWLRLSGHMLSHAALRIIVFGAAAILCGILTVYELYIHRRR